MAWLLGAALLAAAPRLAAAVTLSVPANTVLGGVGAAGQVAVSIDVADGVEGADIRFTFPTPVLVVTGEVLTTALSTVCMPLSNSATAGVLQVALACNAPLAGGGVLFNIPVQAAAVGSTSFTITACTLNEGAIACTTTSGNVTVPPPTPTPTITLTRTPTATPTRTITKTFAPTATQTASRTSTVTRTATPVPTVVLNPMSGPVMVGATVQLTGAGFTAGSVVVLFVSAGGGVQQFGPYTPAGHTATTLTWNVPATIPLANGFAAVQIVNTDQGFITSNVQGALLEGAPAVGLPTITGLNGVPLSPANPAVPFANVSTVVLQNGTLTINGTGFSNAVVALYSSNPSAAALEPLAGGSSTQVQVVIPPDIPTGPGAIQVLNRPSFKGSNLVSVPIGERIRLDGVTQSGSTITVNGAGFSVRTVISFFNARPGAVVNLGGLVNGAQSLIPFTLVSSNQLTFQIPAGAVGGPSYVQLLNPPFIPFASTGSSPSGAFNLVMP